MNAGPRHYVGEQFMAGRHHPQRRLAREDTPHSCDTRRAAKANGGTNDQRQTILPKTNWIRAGERRAVEAFYALTNTAERKKSHK